MKTTPWLVALGAVLMTQIGCTTSIGRPNGELVDLAAHEVRARLAVLRFADCRPSEETAPRREFLAWWDTTRDEAWDDEDVAAAVSQEIARHLRESGLYASVDYVPLPSESFGPEEARMLRMQGYDAALLGQIAHFRGMRRWDLARGGVLSLAGPAGGGANFLMGHRAGAETVLRPVRLARTSDGLVLWEGEGCASIAETTYLLGDAGEYANRSLDAAIGDLKRRLDRDHDEIARRLDVGSAERMASPRPDETRNNILISSLGVGVESVKQVGQGVGKVVDSGYDALIDALGLK